jgi:hypothetical protein
MTCVEAAEEYGRRLGLAVEIIREQYEGKECQFCLLSPNGKRLFTLTIAIYKPENGWQIGGSIVHNEVIFGERIV